MRFACASVLLASSALFAQTPSHGQVPAGPTFQQLASKADAARDAHHMDEAVGLYRKALKLKPSWEDGWWSLGSITYDEDKYAECALAFRRLAVLKPDLAAAWTMAGLCEYKLRK